MSAVATPSGQTDSDRNANGNSHCYAGAHVADERAEAHSSSGPNGDADTEDSACEHVVLLRSGGELLDLGNPVELTGLEPVTPCLQSRCSCHLSLSLIHI